MQQMISESTQNYVAANYQIILYNLFSSVSSETNLPSLVTLPCDRNIGILECTPYWSKGSWKLMLYIIYLTGNFKRKDVAVNHELKKIHSVETPQYKAQSRVKSGS